MSENNWSVLQLVQYLKRKLSDDITTRNIWIKGEISGFSASYNGHLFFTLKDEKAALSCIMYAGNTRGLKFSPKDGDKILVRGTPSIYEAQGRLQFSVSEMKKEGLGDLAQQLEELKARLLQEGYFSETHKKELPSYPFDIAVITGKKSAAEEDVLKHLRERWPVAQITVYNCLVQGALAAKQIIECLKKADNQHHDVIILARGGGSLEDLWCFNDEELVKTIYLINTPIVTGIGHEIDFTLADFAADKRANTPTGAAIMVTPNIEDVYLRLANTIHDLKIAVDELLTDYSDILKRYEKYSFPKMKDDYIRSSEISLMMLTNRLEAFPSQLEIKQKNLRISSKTLSGMRYKLMEGPKYQIQADYDKMKNSIRQLIQNHMNALNQNTDMLNAISYQKMLEKGFAIVSKADRILRNTKDIEINEKVSVRLSDGTIKAEVIGKGE